VSSRGPGDVEAALTAADVAYRRFEAKAARASEAAESLGVELGAVVKSLLFLVDGAPTLVLIGGDQRADTKKLKDRLRARRVMIASPTCVLEETGYPVGAVPPLGHTQRLSVWIDAGLAAHDTVYVSGGARDVMIALAFDDLLHTTSGRVTDVSE
jgi:Cys-tRNA(Pro) deacylase